VPAIALFVSPQIKSPMTSTPASLQKFVQYCQQYLKGESQTFLDRFFQAFGHEGAIDAGATLEERVKKGSKKGNMGFADLAWKPHLLIEMKKRGEDLNKHYAQALFSCITAVLLLQKN